jgi:hypothetical protein
MPTERRRIRDRLYQRKRRLRRQVLAGKITEDRIHTGAFDYNLNLPAIAGITKTINAETRA